MGWWIALKVIAKEKRKVRAPETEVNTPLAKSPIFLPKTKIIKKVIRGVRIIPSSIILIPQLGYFT